MYCIGHRAKFDRRDATFFFRATERECMRVKIEAREWMTRAFHEGQMKKKNSENFAKRFRLI